MNKYQGESIFLSLLTVMFIALKLLGIISWGWLWVLSPLWIPAVLVLVFFAVIILIAVFKERKT